MSGSLRGGFAGAGIAAAAFASSPKLALWRDQAWVMRDRAAAHSWAGTPKRSAAAASSISRAAAPATRMP